MANDDQSATFKCEETSLENLSLVEESPKYLHIDESILRCEEALDRDTRDLECECNPSKKDKLEGQACGANCINRLLLMECWGRCKSGKYCTNRRFQNKQNAYVDMFFTGQKGWGLKAQGDIKKGDFIIEYVGEVVDTQEMEKRIRRYGKDPKHKHHYLMALNSLCVVDATIYGNLSRFINHSCDPNAATEKWTVGNEIRVGFFAIKSIKAGEEICFDYKFERYGRKAQECFCGSFNCTGYIGAKENRAETVDVELSDSNDDVSDIEEASKLPIFRRKLPPTHSNKKKLVKVTAKRQSTQRMRSAQTLKKKMEMNEINAMIAKGTLRNRDQVLEFNRLMVRIDELESRQKIVELLIGVNDPDIHRLFVANQGLRLIRMWLMLPDLTIQSIQLQSKIVKLLLRLPVTYRNQINETHIMEPIQKILQLEAPIETTIEDLVYELVDAVSLGLDGVSSAKPKDPILEELDNLKHRACQLSEKWEGLIEYNYRIPKKKAISTDVVSKIPIDLSEKEKFKEKHHRHGHENDHNKSKSNIPFGPRLNGIKPSHRMFFRDDSFRGRIRGHLGPGFFFKNGFGFGKDRRPYRHRFFNNAENEKDDHGITEFKPCIFANEAANNIRRQGRSVVSCGVDLPPQCIQSATHPPPPPPLPPVLNQVPVQVFPAILAGTEFYKSSPKHMPVPVPPPDISLQNAVIKNLDERLQAIKQVAAKSNAELISSKHEKAGTSKKLSETKDGEHSEDDAKNVSKSPIKKFGKRAGKRFMSRAAVQRMNRDRFRAKCAALLKISDSPERFPKARSRTPSPPSRPRSQSHHSEKRSHERNSRGDKAKDNASDSFDKKKRTYSRSSRSKKRRYGREISPSRDGWESAWLTKISKRGGGGGGLNKGGRLSGKRGRGIRGRGRGGGFHEHSSRNEVSHHSSWHEEKARAKGTNGHGKISRTERRPTHKKKRRRSRSYSSSGGSARNRKATATESSRHRSKRSKSCSSSSSSSSSTSSSHSSHSSHSTYSSDSSSTSSISSLSYSSKTKKRQQKSTSGKKPDTVQKLHRSKAKSPTKINLKPPKCTDSRNHLRSESRISNKAIKSENIEVCKQLVPSSRPPVPLFLKKPKNTEPEDFNATQKNNVFSGECIPNLPPLTLEVTKDPEKFDSYINLAKQFVSDLENIRKNIHFCAHLPEHFDISSIKREIDDTSIPEGGPPKKRFKNESELIVNTPPEDPSVAIRNGGSGQFLIEQQTLFLTTPNQSHKMSDETSSSFHHANKVIQYPTTSSEEPEVSSSVSKTSAANEKRVSKSGNWLEAVDAQGQVYYYHRLTRESTWELPDDEKLGNGLSICEDDKSKISKLPSMEKRAQFKHKVYDLTAKQIEPYRKRFFPSNSDYQSFVRKIIHTVLENQDKTGNNELDFDDTVAKATRRLVEQYIQQFKARHSTSTKSKPPSSAVSATGNNGSSA